MASKRMRKNGTWEYSFLRKGLLPGRVYLTFDTEVEGMPTPSALRPSWTAAWCLWS